MRCPCQGVWRIWTQGCSAHLALRFACSAARVSAATASLSPLALREPWSAGVSTSAAASRASMSSVSSSAGRLRTFLRICTQGPVQPIKLSVSACAGVRTLLRAASKASMSSVLSSAGRLRTFLRICTQGAAQPICPCPVLVRSRFGGVKLRSPSVISRRRGPATPPLHRTIVRTCAQGAALSVCRLLSVLVLAERWRVLPAAAL